MITVNVKVADISITRVVVENSDMNPLQAQLDELCLQIIEVKLSQCGGNRSAAAKALGYSSHAGLCNRIKRLQERLAKTGAE